jgi:hypothetical protein
MSVSGQKCEELIEHKVVAYHLIAPVRDIQPQNPTVEPSTSECLKWWHEIVLADPCSTRNTADVSPAQTRCGASGTEKSDPTDAFFLRLLEKDLIVSRT